jgi:hypothetical protein
LRKFRFVNPPSWHVADEQSDFASAMTLLLTKVGSVVPCSPSWNREHTQIPLEAMDWVVDLKGQKLIGNPAHGGEHVIEVY